MIVSVIYFTLHYESKVALLVVITLKCSLTFGRSYLNPIPPPLFKHIILGLLLDAWTIKDRKLFLYRLSSAPSRRGPCQRAQWSAPSFWTIGWTGSMNWSDPFLRTGSPAGRTTIGSVQALDRLVQSIVHRSIFDEDLLVNFFFFGFFFIGFCQDLRSLALAL